MIPSIDIPHDLRLVGLFLIGLCVGGVVNWAIYRLAYFPRAISPWSVAPTGAPPRRWHDRLPVVGWLGLRREMTLHGRGHWVRPLAIELGCGAMFAWLYDWEVVRGGLLGELPIALWGSATLHATYLAHVILFSLMIVASFIDIDETIIPDSVTVPGTLVGLLLAAVVPTSLLPVFNAPAMEPATAEFLRITTPNPWPQGLGGAPHTGSLVIGLACYALWFFALMPRRWRGRRGWRMALGLITARVAREARRPVAALIGAGGLLAIGAVWWLGGQAWEGLLTALVGMAVGGGIIWLVRLVGTAVLHKEAMGFGDVTLMAMIGTFLGWQPCLMVFFLAPFAGLIIGVAQWIVNRGHEIPYGPFLCLAAAFVVVRWATVWERAEPFFALGWIVPAIMLTCLVLMAVMLGAWRVIREKGLGVKG